MNAYLTVPANFLEKLTAFSPFYTPDSFLSGPQENGLDSPTLEVKNAG